MSDQCDDRFDEYFRSDEWTSRNGHLLPPIDETAYSDDPQVIIREDVPPEPTFWDFLGAMVLDVSFVGWLAFGMVIGIAVRVARFAARGLRRFWRWLMEYGGKHVS